MRSRLLVSERRTCAVVGQPRVTQRRRPLRDDEAALMADDVLQCLTDLFVEHGPPEHIRSDNVLSDESRVDDWASLGEAPMCVGAD